MPSDPKTNRKLAAILFADIQGYTAMMQRDEQNASIVLRHFQKQLEEKVRAHSGSIVNFYGDGALCTFQIPIDAMRCAMALQATFGESPKTPVRIGIHSGTVTVEGGKIFGDSVNIASRIESMGCAGSILFSKKVRDEVKNNPDLKLQSLGNFEFKNVDEPMEVFALANQGLVLPDVSQMKGPTETNESAFSSTPLFKVIAGIVLVTVAVLLYNQLGSNNAEKDIQTTEASINTIPISDKSVAVLPFTDLSPSGDQEYFSIGMMEEILNHLAKIEGLQVKSRTSVMQYAGTTKPITDISKELRVANLLEGSVRKAGNQVRITVQLIDGKTDDHLWSETYDKQMDDVFGIQSDVAQSIAGILKTEINPEVIKRIEAIPTTNIEAYEMWLKGKSYDLDEIEKADSVWKRAIEIDPTFAPAYASLGYSWMSKGGFAGELDREDIISNATYYLEKAIDIDPYYPLTHQMLGSFHLWYHWDFERAEKEFETYEKLNPAFLDGNIFDFYNATGRFEEAKERSEKMYRAEPNNVSSWNRRGLAYCLSGAFETGEHYYKEAIRRFPDNWYIKSEAGRAFSFSGKYGKTIEYITHIHANNPEFRLPRDLGYLAMAYYHNFNKEAAAGLLNELIAKSEKSATGSPSFYIAMVYTQMGDVDKAFEWLEKAYQNHEVEMFWLKVEPPFKPLHGDPRWKDMLDKVGFPE